jgi:hypothetical protein
VRGVVTKYTKFIGKRHPQNRLFMQTPFLDHLFCLPFND